MAVGGLKMKLVLVTMAAIAGICSAATHTVGDKTGWSVQPSPFYSNWASKQSFKAGDVLVFKFQTGQHTVAEVPKAAYDSCNTTDTLSAAKTTGPANYTLSSGGRHYYICTFPGHCSAGQKLAVTVSGSSSAAPSPSPPKTTPSQGPSAPKGGPSSSPNPIPGTTGSAPSAGGSTSPPPGNSGATAVAGVSLLSLVAFAVAALF